MRAGNSREKRIRIETPGSRIGKLCDVRKGRPSLQVVGLFYHNHFIKASELLPNQARQRMRKMCVFCCFSLPLSWLKSRPFYLRRPASISMNPPPSIRQRDPAGLFGPSCRYDDRAPSGLGFFGPYSTPEAGPPSFWPLGSGLTPCAWGPLPDGGAP